MLFEAHDHECREKMCSVAVHWVLIIHDRARYLTIEQRPIDIMILGCLNFFWPGSTCKCNLLSPEITLYKVRHRANRQARFCFLLQVYCRAKLTLRQDPFDLSFWSFLTFLHHGIIK